MEEIKIYSYGNRKFDRTGVSARDDFQYILKKDNAKPYDRSCTIGYGETISNRGGGLSLGRNWH